MSETKLRIWLSGTDIDFEQTYPDGNRVTGFAATIQASADDKPRMSSYKLAAEIVDRVNAHEQLLSALKAIANGNTDGDTYMERLLSAEKLAKAAILAAERVPEGGQR